MNTDRFKFRVWNKKTGKYFFEADESVLLEQDGSLSILYWHDGEDSVMPADRYYGKETLVIERCTGLRDKLGKLIYEGDIVNLSPADSEEYKNRLVYWCRDHWGTKELDSPDVWSFSPLNEMEIVGNIHERS